ncbi:uncharacterized protein [Dysidea avara]|uniref:uncharacterized protein n=1 Tax=Dysidea avara TaxID=196820 RepID=UPI00332E41CE
MTTNLLVLFQFVFLLGNIGVEGKTDPFDRSVLDYIYNATYDRAHRISNWTNWGNSSDPCTDNWYGITCVEDQSVYYVSGIDLPHHLLTSLPDKIVDMKQLRNLLLRGNDIRAEGFPLGIFAMQTLERLDISEMYLLNISLPTRIELPNLQQLYASESRLLGYLPTTWKTPKLESLMLDSNDFMGRLPDDISKCTGLKQLMLQRNRLTGNFPGSYGNLHQLVNLSLIQSSTDYRGLCGSMPDTWETMFSLEDVSLCVFGFGPLPDYIGENWQQLQSLRITGGSYGNNDIPISLCKLTQLQRLDFSQNRFTGTIPDCIFTMPSLTYLDLSFNHLSGQISEAIGLMDNVIRLSLANNYLNGTLPRSIGKLSSITYLSLAENLFVGEIPSEFDMLRNGDRNIVLYLQYNMLSSIGDGLEYFFRDIQGNYFENPFECPLPPYVINGATCSLCNSGTKRNSCEDCVSAGCGWCSYGNNCIEGTHQGPVNQYTCPEKYWSFGTCRGA